MNEKNVMNEQINSSTINHWINQWKNVENYEWMKWPNFLMNKWMDELHDEKQFINWIRKSKNK